MFVFSFWGKFGQRDNMQHTEIVDDYVDFLDLLSSDEQEVTHLHFINENRVEMRWRYTKDFIQASDKTNVVVAAYTTAQARLKLYNYLEQLNERALYCDTDSIVFTTKPGESELFTGDYLGDLTNEEPDYAIEGFVTGGPKNYAYKRDNGTTVCKVRGITLNYKNALTINYQVVKDMVTGVKQDDVVVNDDFQIVRNRNTSELFSTQSSKTYKIVFDKRVLTANYMSLPYGF